MVANKSDVEQAVFCQLFLHVHEEILYITILGVFGALGDVICPWVESGGQPLGVALVHSAVTSGTRFRLGYGDEQSVGRIDRQNVARAGPRVVHVADTVTATDHYPRSGRVGKAQARTEVIPIRIYQRLSIHPAS